MGFFNIAFSDFAQGCSKRAFNAIGFAASAIYLLRAEIHIKLNPASFSDLFAFCVTVGLGRQISFAF